MAKLALVYGVRLLPSDELESFEEGKVRLKNGQTAGVRAAVSTLVEGRRPTIDHITQDEEMFI